MADLNQFEMQRELLIVEEKLIAIKQSFDSYMPDDCPEKRRLVRLVNNVDRSIAEMRRFFK